MSESYNNLVYRLFHKVKNHMQWDDEKTDLWFRSGNPNLGGASPYDFIYRRPEKAEKWVDSLIER